MCKDTRNPHEVVEQEDAIERIVCEPLAQAQVRQMNKEEAEMLMKALIMPKTTTKEIMEFIPKSKTPQILQIIVSRLKLFDYTLEGNLLFLMMMLCDTPGTVVIYLTQIQYYCYKNDIKVFTTQDFVNMFPMGVLSEPSMHKVWLAQKVLRPDSTLHSDNLLDYSGAMKSMRFKPVSYV
jgi:hypothetical protein